MRSKLAQISPNDKPWDIHKYESRKLADFFANFGKQKKSLRVHGCANALEFAEGATPEGEVKYRLHWGQFCRVRYCPICEWRKALMWRARFYQNLPDIMRENPTVKYVYMVLTVPNCHITELKDVLGRMQKAWNRLRNRTFWKSYVKGFVKTLEITRNKKDGSCHPHFNVIMAVPSNYFTKNYVPHEEWLQWWNEVYQDPRGREVTQLYISRISNKKPKLNGKVLSQLEEVMTGVVEVLKYSVKPSDLLADGEWFNQLDDIMKNVRAIDTGGILKDIHKRKAKDGTPEEDKPEDFIYLDPQKEEALEILRYIMFHYKAGPKGGKKSSGYEMESYRGPETEPKCPDGVKPGDLELAYAWRRMQEAHKQTRGREKEVIEDFHADVKADTRRQVVDYAQRVIERAVQGIECGTHTGKTIDAIADELGHLSHALPGMELQSLGRLSLQLRLTQPELIEWAKAQYEPYFKKENFESWLEIQFSARGLAKMGFDLIKSAVEDIEHHKMDKARARHYKRQFDDISRDVPGVNLFAVKEDSICVEILDRTIQGWLKRAMPPAYLEIDSGCMRLQIVPEYLPADGLWS